MHCALFKHITYPECLGPANSRGQFDFGPAPASIERNQKPDTHAISSTQATSCRAVVSMYPASRSIHCWIAALQPHAAPPIPPAARTPSITAHSVDHLRLLALRRLGRRLTERRRVHRGRRRLVVGLVTVVVEHLRERSPLVLPAEDAAAQPAESSGGQGGVPRPQEVAAEGSTTREG
eukprot:scaffold17888_cov149-Isochrysis_galbana.AAC.1